MTRRTRVYVAGPISKGDLAQNIARGVEAGLYLLAAGYAPMIPHLACFIEQDAAATYEAWLETDLAWIEVCDAMLRLPGGSAGADREEKHAGAHGVPVYVSLACLMAGEGARR